MPSLSDTVARLAAQRRHLQAPQPAGQVDRLSALADFGPNPGNLAARIYRPAGHAPGRPLVVVLHGCTQSAAGYDHHSGWSRLADEAGFALLYPEQQRANNPNLCFNWFLPEDTRRGGGEARSIRSMIAAMDERHGVDPRRIFITGLSAGGAMAASMLASYPEVFAGGAPIGALPHGVARSVPEAFDRMRGQGTPAAAQLRALLREASRHDGDWPRLSIWHGEVDQTVAVANGEAILAQWQGVHGVDGAGATTSRAGNRTTRTWTGPGGGPAIELHTIAGMGHGTPVDARDLGTPGPFMLDVGVSSTREIARFWGIAGSAAAASETIAMPRPATPGEGGTAAPGSRALVMPGDAGAEGPRAEAPRSETPRAAPALHGVGKVIEDALRKAGLMR